MTGYQEAHKEHINKYKMAHMIGVAEYMRERARDYGLDGNEMYVLGLLHDIGYIDGRVGHEVFGADLLSGMGLYDEYVRAIENHGKDPYAVYESAKDADASAVLLLEADMSINVSGHRVGFEKRLEDIGNRYGYDHIAYKTCEDNISFVKEYQAEHGIGKPYSLYHKGSRER